MARKNVSAIETGAGFFQGLVTNLMDVAREKEVPFEAMYRLATPEGRTTLGKIVALVREDWAASQSAPVFPPDGPPYRTAPKNGDTTIIMPDCSARQFIAEARPAFTRFNENAITLIERDWELVKGKTLSVLMHTFGRSWTTQEARDLQKSQGSDGNAAALLVWDTQTKRRGWSVSIPNTNDRLFRLLGHLFAPYFTRDEQYREFRLLDVVGEWLDDFVLVAFRAI